jgi:N-acetylmuramoyl-L-alanine amidase/putative methionine-R-sulfoxide reductase with GAF domain
MATTPTKPTTEVGAALTDAQVPLWPREHGRRQSWRDNSYHTQNADNENNDRNVDTDNDRPFRSSGGDALQALLAFSALHQQVRQRRALAAKHNGFETIAASEFEPAEQFVLDEVLQLVAERAVAITGADGLGIALAENNEIVLRASSGTVRPDVGARIQRDSAFSGACFRSAQIIRCDDTETDERVNLRACRALGARSMVAVPLCGRRRVIGLLEAFSADPFGFNDSDVASLELLAELILSALKPEDEDRFAESALAAEIELAAPPSPVEILKPAEVPVADGAAAAEQPLAQITDEAIVTPATLESPAIDTLPEPATEPELHLEAPTISAEKIADHHPGMLLVLVLIVAAALLGAELWWKLKNSQLGNVMVHPEQKMITTTAPKQPAAPSLTPLNPNAAQQNSSAQVTSGEVTPGVDASTPADQNVATPESGKLSRITGIRHWSAADSSTVVLDLGDQVQYEAHRLANPDRIYFDLHDTSLAPDLEGKIIEIGDALLTRVRVAQPTPGLTRVVLETKGNSDYSVSLEPSPYRLVVQVRKLGVNTKAELNLFPGSAPGSAHTDRNKLSIVVPLPTHEDLQLRAHVAKMRIVVDAGHGGWDLGTVGRRGLLEKDLVLEIAQRLGMLLESRLGAEVILTRNDDTYIPLDERASMANHAQADLFVSVHANYSDLPSARGVETYYTNFFSAPNAKDIETRPGATGGKNPITAVLSAADLHDRIEQSRRLAASVQRSLYGVLSIENPGLRDRGVKEASYVVLTETAMPGILAEVSFVSSPTDEQKLRSNGYREQIAEALYRGIARYAASSHPVKMASAVR